MSKHFERIKVYYQKGIYKIEHLKKLVKSGAITEAEYQDITRKTYTT